MKKMYFIVNLVAGKARISKKLGAIVDEFTKAGYYITIHTTQSGDDAAEWAKYACHHGYDLLVCAGGDGTLSQCLQGIMECEDRIPIGYIPAGSTNDFAKNLGIPTDTIEAVRYIINGKPCLCDIGSLNSQSFSYVAAFGAFTNITYDTSQRVKNLFGHAAYMVNGAAQLNNIKAKKMRIECDGEVIEDEFIYGMVTNTASIAGILKMDSFLLDDGIFEVTLVRKPDNIFDLDRTALSLLKNDTEHKNILYFRTSKLVITNLDDEPFSWTRDGEYGGSNIVNTIVNNRRAVEFLVAEPEKLPFSNLTS